MEKFTVVSDCHDYYASLFPEGENLTYDEAKTLIRELSETIDLADVKVYKQYSLRYFGFEDVKKKEVTIDYTKNIIIIDGTEHNISELKGILANDSYTVAKIIGHPTPEGECLDEYLV